MAVNYREYRKKKKWIFTWKHSVTHKTLSLGFDTREEAEAFEAVQRELARKEKKLLKKIRPNNTPSPKITVAELLNTFFSNSYSNPKTLKQTEHHVVPILRAFGNRQAILLTGQDMFQFVAAQKMRGVARSTANRRISILRAALNWAVRTSIIPRNPLADLRLPQARSQRIAPPTRQEAISLLQHSAPHIQRVIIMGIHIGARIGPSELFRLCWNDIDLQAGIIRLPSAKKNHREDGRDIPIRQDMRPLLRVWREFDSHYACDFVIHRQGKPVNSIAKAWSSAKKRAGILRKLRPYDLRHAYATYSLAAGADLKTVSELMGHQDANMILQTYQHIPDQLKLAAVEAIPDIFELGKRNIERLPGLP